MSSPTGIKRNERGPVRFSVVRWALRILFAVSLFAVAFNLRFRGLDWPDLHPDSENMTRWMRWTRHHPYVLDRVYPSGFFTLFRPFQKLEAGGGISRINRAAERLGLLTPPAARLTIVLLARQFNALLGALTCLVLLLLTWSVTGSFPAAAFAAALAAFNPWHIEHCHYAETDIAMVFALSLALLLWSRVERRPGPVFFIPAALVSGFAAGVKYPLLLLIVLVAAYALGRPFRRRALLWLPAGLLLFLAGFLLADPAPLLDPGRFANECRVGAAGVAAEAPGVVGLASGLPLARFRHQLFWGSRFLRALGAVRLVVILVGTWFLLRRPWRSRWRVTLLFPLVYAAYLVGLAPWIRMQEILPLMPFFACATASVGAPLAAWARSGRSRLRRTLVLLLVAAVLLPAAVTGTRRANLFTTCDTRHWAEDWLQRHFPRGTALGAEIYTKSRPGRPVPVPELEAISKIEWRGLDHARDVGASYLLRNATLPGRGAFNPFTGRLYGVYERNRREFLDDSELLAAWSPLGPEDETTFAFVNPELQLYGLRRYRERLSLEVPLLTPCLVPTDGEAGCFPLGRRLGGSAAIAVDPRTRRLVIGGPELPPGGPFLVFVNRGPATVVRWRGRGRVETRPAAVGGAFAVPLTDLPFRSLVERFASIRVRTERAGAGAARVVFDRWQAAALLLDSGDPEGALELLETPTTPNELLVRFLAKVSAGIPPNVAEVKQARETLRLLERADGLSPRELRVNGVSGYYLEQFARIYLGKRDVVYPSGALREGVLAPSGRWHLRAEVRSEPGSDWTTVVEKLQADRQKWLDLFVSRLDDPGTVPGGEFPQYRNAEIFWTLADQLANLRQRLVTALAAASPPLGEAGRP